MNGETANACELVLSTIKSIKEGSNFIDVDSKFINQIQFDFLPEKNFFSQRIRWYIRQQTGLNTVRKKV